jgi:transcriptional regulator with XRE-family HTH domain
LRERREELGLTQKEVAFRMPDGTDSQAVSKWERDEHEPSPAKLLTLAAALELTPEELLDGIPRQRPASQLDRIEAMLSTIGERLGVNWAEVFAAAAAPTLAVFESEAGEQAGAETAPVADQPPEGKPARGRSARARARK